MVECNKKKDIFQGHMPNLLFELRKLTTEVELLFKIRLEVNKSPYTQNEKLSNSCQTNCHCDNFMVYAKKLSRLSSGCLRYNPDNPKVVNR